MKTLKKKIIAGVLGGMLMLSAVAGISAANVTAGAETQARKVNEYEGQHLAKVNEYEGQHRIAEYVVATNSGGGSTGDVVIISG